MQNRGRQVSWLIGDFGEKIMQRWQERRTKPPFCRYQGECDYKHVINVVGKSDKRRYYLCKNMQGCNQQTIQPIMEVMENAKKRRR